MGSENETYVDASIQICSSESFYLTVGVAASGDEAQQIAGQEQAATFMLGTVKVDKPSDKQNADRKIGDERISEMKGDKQRNTKNERHNYTVDLRKKKR